MLTKVTFKYNLEKWDGNATNIYIFFPKKSPITVFDKESIAQNNSVKLAF